MIKQASGLFEGTRGHREAILRRGHVEAGRWGQDFEGQWRLVRQPTEKYHLTGLPF